MPPQSTYQKKNVEMQEVGEISYFWHGKCFGLVEATRLPRCLRSKQCDCASLFNHFAWSRYQKFAKSLLALGALAIDALSHAAPVTTWDVKVIGSWKNFALNPGVSLSGDGLTLSWGSSSPQSSLAITNPVVTS